MREYLDLRVNHLLAAYADASAVRRHFRNAHGAAHEAALLESAVGIFNAPERIAIDHHLDASETSQRDQLTQIGGASIHAGRELSPPGDLAQSEGHRFERATDEGEAPKS